MELTREEFCLFNLKSRIQLVENDGHFLTRRVSGDIYLISLYKLYDFYVETVYDISGFKTLSILPVAKVAIFNLYTKRQKATRFN